MKFLVIGLGSMGKRRIRNLLANGEKGIFGFDMREDRRKEAEELYKIKTFCSFQDAVNTQEFNGFIISVPPDKHIEYMNFAVDNNIHCFVEASVLNEGFNQLIHKQRTGNFSTKICPSCTLRFHPSIKVIKQLIDSGALGKVSNFSYHSGQYLPDWHPWEKIQDFYVSKKETGGCREIVPFELTWLTWVFGDIKKIVGFNSRTIELGIDIDDVYASSIKFENGVLGNLLVDVVSRHAIRKIVINGSEGQIQWDWDKNRVDFYDAVNRRWITYNEPKGNSEVKYNANIIEEMYIEEIKYFIGAVNRIVDFPNSIEDDYKILQYLYQLEESNIE